MSSPPFTKSLEGILVVGSDAGCGKTAVTAGLAAAIGAAGFRVQALKPLAFGGALSFKNGSEQAFINKVTQQFIQAETLQAPSSRDLSPPFWNKMLEQCKTLQYPCLLEGPGQVATPWQIQDHRVIDALDVAAALGLPVLLVSQAGSDFLEKTRSALTFIQSRGIEPLGFIRVESQKLAHDTHANALDSLDLSRSNEVSEILTATMDEPLLISRLYHLPFLGDLPYSPSISVSGLQQGNLVRLVQENIDILPLQMGIGLKL